MLRTSSTQPPARKRRRIPAVLCVLLAAVFAAPGRAADLIPLKHGVYSIGNCNDAPNAAILTYDGQTLSGAHEHDCHSTLVTKRDTTYIVRSDCVAAGEGEAQRHTETLVINRQKAKAFQIISKSDVRLPDGPLSYRWCSASLPK